MADGSLPSNADIAAAIGAGHVASDPDQLSGPAPGAAPAGPVYNPELDVGLNPDGSVAYVPNPHAKGVTVASDAQGVIVSGDPTDTISAYSSDPDIVRAYVSAHPEVHGAKAPASSPNGDALPSADDVQQAIAKNGFSTDPGEAASSPQAPAPTPDVPFGSAGAGLSAFANAATLGFGRKAAAAINALLDGGTADFGQRYSQNMDAYQALDRQAWNQHPVAVASGAVGGTLATGLALPEVEGASWGARALSGARQGAVLGALDSAGNTRGGVDKWAPAAIEGAGTGLVTGGALGGWLGRRPAKEALDPDLLHIPTPTVADYEAAQTTPIAAVGGPETAQRIGQILAGTPLAGAPLQNAAARWRAQTAAQMARTIGAYGESAAPEEAGSAISAANQRILDRIAAGRQGAAQAVQTAGSGAANAREAGEQVQGAVERFAGNGEPAPNALGQPSRATSFGAKSQAAYEKAFTRIDNEMAATRAKAATAQSGAKLHEALFADTGVSPTGKGAIAATSPHIEAAETRAVVKSILSRAQSPHVRGLLEAPQVQRVAAAVGEPEKLSFNDLRNLRTWVRYAQRNQELRQTIGDADLQRMESALTKDIYSNAERLASPGAAQQLKRADRYYRLGSERIKDALATFANAPAGERAFDRILSAASSGPQGDIQRLQALQKSLRTDEWRSVAKAAVMRLGEGPQGFDLDRFVAGFDKLSPEGRQALFGSKGMKLNEALQTLVERGRAALAEKPDLHFGPSSSAPTPAAAFQGLMAAAQRKGKAANVAAIEALRQAIPNEQWGDVAASVLHEIGQGKDGFSLTTFASGWTKLSDSAKAALFGGEGREGEVRSLNALAKLGAQEARASKFYNHSNSGHQATGMMALLEAADGLMSGDHEKLIAMGAAMTAGRFAAHLLSEPGFSRLMVRLHTADTPEAIRAVSRRMGTWLQAHPQEARALQSIARGATRIRRNAPVTLGVTAATRRQSQLREAAQSEAAR